ncbi:MAG: hypothetical protein QM657_04620 [Lacrimispora sp.]|uniref:hypothetical protein n=1 Tax=Lacrimispora sp. TaxID=2719234 RepID=UPI0039E5BE5E
MNKIIGNLGYIFIISGMVIAEKHSTNASWIAVIRSQFWEIIFVIIVAIIAEAVAKAYQEHKKKH